MVNRRFAAFAAGVALVVAGAAHAITFGEVDGNRHPNVGALVAELDGERLHFCSGTLVSPVVFVTASHCTAALASLGVAPGDVWVTFDPEFDPAGTHLPGTYHTHPEFGFQGPGGRSDPHDVAVVVLDAPAAGITPAALPARNAVDTLDLRREWFTAVGYGVVREEKRTGPHAFFYDGVRRFATQTAMSVTNAWLNLSMNPSTGDGGTCFGDSGGPHFLRDTNVVVSLTVTGDAVCRATDVTYRLDTDSARAFLGRFVALP